MNEVTARLIHEPSTLTDQELRDLMRSAYDDDKPYTHALCILEEERRKQVSRFNREGDHDDD